MTTLTQNLIKNSIVEKMILRVKTKNKSSVFWPKIGFEEIASSDDSKDIPLEPGYCAANNTGQAL
jgi:hypothetical protein